MNKCDISGNSRLHDISPSINLFGFLFVTRSHNTLLKSARVITNGNRAMLYGGRSTSRGKEIRYTSSMSTKTLDEGALGDEFEANFTLEVHLLEELVTGCM